MWSTLGHHLDIHTAVVNLLVVEISIIYQEPYSLSILLIRPLVIHQFENSNNGIML